MLSPTSFGRKEFPARPLSLTREKNLYNILRFKLLFDVKKINRAIKA
jgi:hypothetical protein